MNAKILVVIVIVVLGLVFFFVRDANDDVETDNQPNGAEEAGFPAPDGSGEGVDEMIVGEDAGSADGGSAGSTDGGSAEVDDTEGSVGAVQEEEAEVSGPVTVTYTNNGFTPKKINVSKGDTVKWVNESSRRMWVASAVHPIHTIYPEKTEADCLGSSFDACTGISVGQSYEFTFNEAGSWNYHNHLVASQVGTVVVVE